MPKQGREKKREERGVVYKQPHNLYNKIKDPEVEKKRAKQKPAELNTDKKKPLIFVLVSFPAEAE